jgi:DUF1680 family protein
MKHKLQILVLAGLVASLTPALGSEAQVRRLPVKEFTDKMQGAWLGQMIGVGWGAPTEFKVKGEIIPEDKMPPWKPEMVNQHGNDDCYVEMTFLRTLEEHGFDASIRQAGIDFANSGYPLWCANQAGRENLRKGIAPPDSSHPKFSAHGDDIDYQIEADFSGIIAPGLPNVAIALGEKFGRLMNYGDGLYAGQFIGGMYAEAYFQSDPRRLIEAGLRCIPPDSQYALMVRDMLAWSKENADWAKTWQLVEEKYHKDPRYSHGLSGKPGGKGEGSIDVKLNGAYILMGLLYGAGDPDKTMVIACRGGQDSDCNPANAGGVFFAALGASKIPARFIEKLDPSRKFSFSDYTLPKVYEVSEKLVRVAVARAGGRVEKDANGEEVFVIPVQTPKPSALERTWEPGPAADSKFTPGEMAQIKGTREYRNASRAQTASIKPLPFKISAKLSDAAEMLSPSAVDIEGWLGARVDANEAQRLLVVDTEPLLAGFRKKPGSHPWIGEHVGKWLHAATLAWANTGDAALRAKLDRVAAELIATQEPDGYLGTYVPEQRFMLVKGADWDVWSHKYNLIGLLTYYQFTGNEAALNACRKIGDLLIATFPAKKSILAAGTHVGMAATSVLEPVVLLYRLTGDERYLDFARYIVKSWDEPNGPAILKTLLTEKQVNKVANGKAYEMLSNLVGLCELARVTGDREMLQAVLNAWQDIVYKRLYITGSASAGEHFPADHVLRNDALAHIGETCVTTTWIQFNLELLRFTGEAKFGDELERAFYNHLSAAQHPQGHDWCYYTALEGRKPYDKGISCCQSSGPRGMALVPQSSYLASRDALLVSTFETSRVTLEIGGQQVTVEQQSQFPRRGESVLTLHLAKPATFAVKIRAPAWAAPVTVAAASIQSGWAVLPAREWKDGDRIAIKFNLAARLVAGDYGNTGRAALMWGPFVLAYDQKLNPDLPKPGALGLVESQPPFTLQSGTTLAFSTKVVGATGSKPVPARFVTFADAGAEGGVYRIWLRAPGVAATALDSLLADGTESRSRQGNQHGSIKDDDLDSIVVTFDGKRAQEDWFAVTLAAPVSIRHVVFAHGRNFPDGGWFDARAGKPRMQVQRSQGGAWETVGEFSDYPATTATNNGQLKSGQTFTLRLSNPEKVLAVRVLGVPAGGNNPKQAFSSCAELQAFGE